jgi:hypothetical protein
VVFNDIKFILHLMKLRHAYQKFKGGGEMGLGIKHRDFLSPLPLLGTKKCRFVSRYKQEIKHKDQVKSEHVSIIHQKR